VKIADYFETVMQQYTDQTNALKGRLRIIEEEIAAQDAQAKTTEKERKKMQDLLADPPAQAFDTGKANEAIAAWDTQIGECKEKKRALTAEKEFLVSKAAGETPSRYKLLSSLLSKIEQCEEAQEVQALDDCWPHCTVEIQDLDDAGRPKSCRIALGGEEARTLKITGNEKQFVKEFRPPGLKWLPAHRDVRVKAPSDWWSRNRRFSAFLDSDRKLILCRTKIKLPPSFDYAQRQEQYKNHEEDFSDIACSLSARFDEIVAEENNALDLTKDYSGSALMAHLQGIVLSRTTDEPEFEPADEEIGSAEIEERIKEHWEAFMTCSWSGAIEGALALLKYSVENRERVRFWSGDFKNHYGFRLRTRDHDWLVGEVFVATPPMSPPGRLKVWSNSEVATIGALALRVRNRCY
jgi:hypothetical protein